MTSPALTSTDKGQLPKAKRITVPIRLLTIDHTELKKTADDEDRSMSFIAMRRYQAGLQLEQAKSDLDEC